MWLICSFSAHVALADLHLDMEVYYAAETNMAATLVSSRQQDVRHLGNVLDINTAKVGSIKNKIFRF